MTTAIVQRLPRRLPAVLSASASRHPTASTHLHSARAWLSQTSRLQQSEVEIDDPNMNGGYINPPRVKRQHRDPYGDWWDKTDRRNYGEPVHEDGDLLGRFTPEDYTHFTMGRAARVLIAFVGAFVVGGGVIAYFRPDRPHTRRTFDEGLETALGGPGALRAMKPGEEKLSDK